MVRLSVSAEMAPNYDPAAQPPEAEPLDMLFSHAYDFACSRSFTAAELHSFLLELYPLSPEPAAFEEMLPRILECVTVLAQLKHGGVHRWRRSGEGYETALYTYVEGGEQPATEQIIEFAPTRRAEIARYDDDNAYAVGTPTGLAEPTRYRTLNFDYRTDTSTTVKLHETVVKGHGTRFESPPPRFDLAFNAVELAQGRTALDRLSWAVARDEGVLVGQLARHMLTPGMHIRPEDIARARTVIARMWIRQVVRREVSDPRESRIYLPADFPRNDHADFSERMRALRDNLRADFSSH